MTDLDQKSHRIRTMWRSAYVILTMYDFDVALRRHKDPTVGAHVSKWHVSISDTCQYGATLFRHVTECGALCTRSEQYHYDI